MISVTHTTFNDFCLFLPATKLILYAKNAYFKRNHAMVYNDIAKPPFLLFNNITYRFCEINVITRIVRMLQDRWIVGWREIVTVMIKLKTLNI